MGETYIILGVLYWYPLCTLTLLTPHVQVDCLECLVLYHLLLCKLDELPDLLLEAAGHVGGVGLQEQLGQLGHARSANCTDCIVRPHYTCVTWLVPINKGLHWDWDKSRSVEWKPTEDHGRPSGENKCG